MLTPEYLAQCADTILGLYDELDRAIIADIARRLVKTGGITPTAAHQIDKVQQSGLLLNEVTERVASISGLSQDEIERLFEESGLVSVRNDASPLLNAGVVKNVSLSPAMRQTLEAAVNKTNGDLRNLTLTTGVTASDKYLNAANTAYMKVTSGAFSYDQAIRQAIRDAASDGNWVSYASGHRDRLDVAVRRSVLTGVNQTAGKLTELYAADMGCEYYETSAHAGARPSHSVWQGRVFKIEGSTSDYPNFAEETGYGTGAGLCGWNCRHSFYPFFPGISKPAYTQKQLDWYDAPRFTYNGASLTEYEVSQLMRKNERQIRATKRELAGYRAAADEAADEQLRSALQEDFEKTSVKLKNQEARYKDLCKQTNHQTDSKRTSVVATKDKNGRIVSWNISTAQKAVWSARKQVDKYSTYHYNKNGTLVVTDTAKRVGKTYKANAVLEVTNAKGSKSRYIYDFSGNLAKQIDNSNHGRPKAHPYGKHGEHAHEYIWENGKITSRTIREITDAERKEHSDIL